MTALDLQKKKEHIATKIKPLLVDLSEEQIDFIFHPINENCHLKACPGSGKTEVVGIKAAYEIAQWTEKYTGLVFLSFTKNAAKEINDRVSKYGGIQAARHPHYIGTIDSWLHNYVLHPFGHKAVAFVGRNRDFSFKLVDNEEKYPFLSQYVVDVSDDTKSFVGAWVNEYYLECTPPYRPISQSRNLNLDEITEDKQKELRENKKKFLKAGLTTYADAESICYFLLKANPSITKLLAKRFPVIYIDECQDLSNNQLEILQLLSDYGIKLHFIGDKNQSIYEFKKVDIDQIQAFITRNKMKELLLTKNFRSNQKIVNVAMKLEQQTTSAVVNHINGHEAYLDEDCCILLEYDPKKPEQLPLHFVNIINSVNNSCSDKERQIDITQSVIVARSHSILSLFKNSPNSRFNKIELFANALNCWNNSPRTGQDMQHALQQLGKSISMLAYNGEGNHQNQYCPENYTYLQWRAFLYLFITDACLPSNNLYPFQDTDWSSWVANLKIFLASKWSMLQDPYNNWESVKSKIISPKGNKKNLVGDSISTATNLITEKIRMTTFHDVKGETMHATMVVSAKDKKSKGGHYEHWLSKELDHREYVRFAYVASSRPKHLLIWAIPKKNKNEHVSTIESLGFKLRKT